MKNILACLILLTFFISCKKNANPPVRVEKITLSQGATYQRDLGALQFEGGFQISQQGTHYSVSEIQPDSTGLIYVYRPIPEFQGTDVVDLSETYSSGSVESERTTILRLVFTIKY